MKKLITLIIAIVFVAGVACSQAQQTTAEPVPANTDNAVAAQDTTATPQADAKVAPTTAPEKETVTEVKKEEKTTTTQ